MKSKKVHKKKVKKDDGSDLWDADPNCKHDIEELWSGIKCKKCNGWFCY